MLALVVSLSALAALDVSLWWSVPIVGLFALVAFAQWVASAAYDREPRGERARLWVEGRMAGLMREFPGLLEGPPEKLAALVRDELENARSSDRDACLLYTSDAADE